jgi:hypothetical protein
MSKVLQFCCSENITHISMPTRQLSPQDISLTKRLCGTDVLCFEISENLFIKPFATNAKHLSPEEMRLLETKITQNIRSIGVFRNARK